MNFSIKLDDNSAQVIRATQEQVEKALEAMAKAYVDEAKANVPVDTGNLRDSISYDVRDGQAEVGTNVEYAAAVELTDASHKTGKAHFLRDSGQDNKDKFEKIARDELSK